MSRPENSFDRKRSKASVRARNDETLLGRHARLMRQRDKREALERAQEFDRKAAMRFYDVQDVCGPDTD